MPLAPSLLLENDRSIGGSKYFSGVRRTLREEGGGLSRVMLAAKRDQQHTHIRGIPSFGEMPFIGRTQEIEQAIRMFTEARSGYGHALVVSGPGGIGKTRFAEEVAARAQHLGATVAIGRCWREGEAPPLWPWRRILRELDAPTHLLTERRSDVSHERFSYFVAVLEYFRQPSRLIRTDGVVATTSKEIVAGKKSDVDKARAIYEWIVDHTFRDPKVKGCGVGDITTMLETGYLGGKCADLNALYVGLARAAGLPARDVYGIRCATSKEFKSLGRAEDVTGAQHCRAEVYLTGYGWTPVDPADVRKVVLEENAPSDPLPLDDPKVRHAREKLFGAWEMNWLPYNYAHDVQLPNSNGPILGFFMYPQAETADGRKDSLDPKKFTYTIKAKEI